ncbi:ESAT-6-like protein EsxU [Mycolicibacterium chitae]|uniref:ESAT-6-like protein n=1 Tax=Mycolicibacterium chitae TaxID=1792 RepID=A0A448IAJ4_MYCCI|nr:WXG100 family type VII secretion target [Mycolicibacterium chitae]MCV7105773.1 WXG100 family type VII secretion target [Mycolicibacterium chitae]BBZ00603.1 ESAT-6-like protein EsxU [Mycolicibacterium chitae]VEG49452.1 WXG100 family type VII secretion target [Mycolicibacterium chitae]
MTTPHDTPQDGLATDFALMAKVAALTDARSAEVRGLLHAFVGRLTAVPPSVWSGTAATVFRDVMQRWNAESVRLCTALDAIAETIRTNERALRAATERHAQQVSASAAEL